VHRRLLVCLGLLAGAAGGGSDSDPPRPAPESHERLITVLPDHRFRVGPYSIDRPGAPTSLADVEAALGRDNTCIGKFGEATVRWPRLGLRGEFATLGGFSDADGQPITDGSATGCSHRDQIQVFTLTASAPGWHTGEGLRIGDPLQRLLDLYPRAQQQDAEVWWLHTFHSPIGDGSQQPDMTARVSGDAVRSITVIIGAQGE
jgi:hypothetical protein